MRTKEIKLCEITTSVLFIGFEGEQNYRRFVIDASEVFADMPDAVPGLAIKPPVGNVYPKAVSRVGNRVIWEVSAADCANTGDGEYQLSFSNGNEIGKVFKGQFRVFDSLIGNGSEPDPISDFVENANAVLGELRDMSASASGLPAGSAPTAELTEVGGHKNLAFGIPAGEQGEPGEPGEDGFSPSVSVTDITDGHRVSITDKEGTESFDVMDGTDGEPGQPGQPGFSPVVSVEQITGGHEVTITDADGEHTFDVMNGEKGDKGDPGTPADPTVLIDDTSTATNKVWSAKKTSDEVEDLKNALQGKYEKPSGGIPSTDLASGVQTSLGLADSAYQKPQTGIPASDIASGVIPSVPVTDVQVNGTSVLSQGVANVPVASDSNFGVVKVGTQGVRLNSNNILQALPSSATTIKTGTENYNPIVPSHQHESVFYGLAKVAGSDEKNSSNAVGVYTDAAKVAIQKMLGIYEAPWELIREDTVTNATEADIEITVDGNGNAFELTDVILLFETPKQNADSGKGYYGEVHFYYGATAPNLIRINISTWTQNAGANSHGAWAKIVQKNGLIFAEGMQNSSNGTTNTIRVGYAEDFSGNWMSIQHISDFTVKKINIKAVTGTGHYKLYGKRKWAV